MGALIDTHLRQATIDDLPRLHALVERSYRGDQARRGWTHEADILGGERITLDDLADALDEEGCIVLVAEQEGGIVGSVEIIDRPGGLAYLGMLSVDPVLQNGGLGRRLIAAAEAAARRRFDARRIEMTVIAERRELIAWYERCGYRRTGERRAFPKPNDGVIFHRGSPPVMVVLERLLPA